MEYFDVYNKYGEKTGETVERNDAHKNGIRHRAVQLWIFNRDNQVLIQQRSTNKRAGANLWYISVAGHIESGESIESTLVRETREELGLDISNLTDSIEYLYTFEECALHQNGSYIDDEICDVFMLKADFNIDEITMQPEEVQAVKYIGYADFKQVLLSGDKSFFPHKIGYKMLLSALDELIKEMKANDNPRT